MKVRLVIALAVIAASSALSAAEGDDAVATELKECAPATFEAAVDCLDKALPPDNQAALARPDGPVQAHFGLGLWIRNNWGLWNQGPLYRSMQAYGLTHPDDMSGAILDGFAARERGEPFDIARQAAAFHEERKEVRNEAVKDGSGGSFRCPLPTDPNDRDFKKKFDAAMKNCLDQLNTDRPE